MFSLGNKIKILGTNDISMQKVYMFSACKAFTPPKGNPVPEGTVGQTFLVSCAKGDDLNNLRPRIFVKENSF